MTFNDETERAPRSHSLAVPRVTLSVVEGPGKGTSVDVHGGSARIGSGDICELRIVDRLVSRIHCELRMADGAMTLTDLGSKNGTWVEGLRIREATVPPGTIVRLGDSAYRVQVEGGLGSVPISERTDLGELLGQSVAMRLLYATLERAARTDATVLVLGETGTGKDVVARSLHAESLRAKGPFVPIDCGAIPEHLIESELFGHVRGAFTGAVSNRRGAFEEASGGTLFLDEIGEMPLSMQPKLLRAIETRSIRRVGAEAQTQIDVRIVAATNRSLASAVNEGLFREDLYYRLAVVEVSLPPLRARREDIPLLAQHFYERFAGKGSRLPPSYTTQLKARSWPGNVRELRNVIERAVALGVVTPSGSAEGTSAPMEEPPLPVGIEALVPLHLPLKDAREAWMEKFESVYVRAMLARTGGNVTKAAELAGVSRRFLQRTMARLGVKGGDEEE
ncbi:hypothetical protein BH09MYX1_BH09MYX1_60620 [soil metagenome]